MNCSHAKLAISALLDGEDPTVDVELLGSHLACCAACRSYANGAQALHRVLRLRPAEEIPDQTPQILASLPPRDVGEQSLGIRLGLAVVGAVQLALAAPALFLGTEAGLSTHSARHAGAFAIALAIGFLVAAWRPAQASGILVITAVLVVCLFGAAVADTAAGRTGTTTELAHAPELIGLVALWMLRRHPVRPTHVVPV